MEDLYLQSAILKDNVIMTSSIIFEKGIKQNSEVVQFIDKIHSPPFNKIFLYKTKLFMAIILQIKEQD